MARKSYCAETDDLTADDARGILRQLLCALAECSAAQTRRGLTVGLLHVAEALGDDVDPGASIRAGLECAEALIEGAI